MNSSPTIRIATRNSPLALWQANSVQRKLEQTGNKCELVLIESTGDLQLTQPIYSLGISGVFTKQLDVALLNKQADIAVHSLKDVPTQLAENLFLAAVLERGSYEDVALVKRPELLATDSLSVATSSLRRQAQWLAKYPAHKVTPIRGNVQTRLRKYQEQEIDVIIFARAGLERLNLLPANALTLDWMLPAPAQGAIGIVCREDDEEMKKVLNGINHIHTFMECSMERQFLKTLMGGCSVPISALARVKGNEIEFRGAIHAYDGRKSAELYEKLPKAEWGNAGKETAKKILQQPVAVELIEAIRNKSWN